jgi:uncharacterized protein YceK
MHHLHIIMTLVFVSLSTGCGTYHARLSGKDQYRGWDIKDGIYPALKADLYAAEDACAGETYWQGDPLGVLAELMIVVPLFAADVVTSAVTDTLMLPFDLRDLRAKNALASE